jgi:hypothetical protein
MFSEGTGLIAKASRFAFGVLAAGTLAVHVA